MSTLLVATKSALSLLTTSQSISLIATERGRDNDLDLFLEIGRYGTVNFRLLPRDKVKHSGCPEYRYPHLHYLRFMGMEHVIRKHFPGTFPNGSSDSYLESFHLTCDWCVCVCVFVLVV